MSRKEGKKEGREEGREKEREGKRENYKPAGISHLRKKKKTLDLQIIHPSSECLLSVWQINSYSVEGRSREFHLAQNGQW